MASQPPQPQVPQLCDPSIDAPPGGTILSRYNVGDVPPLQPHRGGYPNLNHAYAHQQNPQYGAATHREDQVFGSAGAMNLGPYSAMRATAGFDGHQFHGLNTPQTNSRQAHHSQYMQPLQDSPLAFQNLLQEFATLQVQFRDRAAEADERSAALERRVEELEAAAELQQEVTEEFREAIGAGTKKASVKKNVANKHPEVKVSFYNKGQMVTYSRNALDAGAPDVLDEV